MKKITLYILIIMLFSSCENMLDEVPKDFVSRSNYYQNETDAQGALNGAYRAVNPDFYGISHYLMVELHGDYLNGRGSQAPISYMDQLLDQRNIGRCATNWLTLYSGINYANAVLDNVPEIEDIADDVRSRILAEAHFLRAMAYFELVRGWGPVPIKTNESTDLADLNSPRMPEEDVYDLIVSDLLVAEEDLPEDVGEETGKAGKWAAKMMLCHVYLTLEKWEEAASRADEVINSGQYEMVRVTEPDDFYEIFATETSSEDIMSVHHSETRTSTIPSYLHRASAYPYNNSSTGYFAWLPDMDTWIGDSWDTADLRKQFNFYYEYQKADGTWVSLPTTIPVLFKKFINNEDGINVYTVPIYRYTEAFLFYAEAACHANGGPSSLALERLNKVKRRAYGYDPDEVSPVDYPSGMSEDEFIEIVLQERAYEFLLERRRWFDLKRTGKVEEAFAAAGKNIIEERMLWPLPEDEINNNDSISKEDQNPGYY